MTDAYPVWSSGTGDQHAGDQRRQAKLDRACADLRQLPDLCAQLAACHTERDRRPGSGGGKVVGSPSLVRLDVLHLVDERRKPGWHGEDPWLQQVVGRYGVAPALEVAGRVLAYLGTAVSALAASNTVLTPAAIEDGPGAEEGAPAEHVDAEVEVDGEVFSGVLPTSAVAEDDGLPDRDPKAGRFVADDEGDEPEAVG